MGLTLRVCMKTDKRIKNVNQKKQKSLINSANMAQNIHVRQTLPYIAAAVGSWFVYKLFIKPFLSPLRKMPGRPYKPIIGNMFEALKEEAMTNTIRWMKECQS